MGAKSTIELTRESAELNYVTNKLKIKERKLQAKAAAMSDKELEDVLEENSDKDGGLVNFSITPAPYADE